MPIVIDVKPLPNYRLLLTFDTKEEKIFDVAPLLNKGIFRELRNIALFNTVRVSFDSIIWANEADICPDKLYQNSISIR
jgi:hypothetical protein